MSKLRHRKRLAIAWRAAQDIPPGIYANLGIGIASEVAQYVPDSTGVIFHSENGILGVGHLAKETSINRNLVNASQQFVTITSGGAFFDCCESFTMLRGGHVKLALLGAYEVAENGDLASWSRGEKSVPPAVGGAMDIVVGVPRIWVLMEHLTKDDRPRLVRRTTLPLTGMSVVDRVYTDRAVIDITPDGGVVTELHPDLSFADLQQITEWPLILSPECTPLRSPSYKHENTQC
jgi:3-oxoacid CoA-transferase B subunit